MASLLARSSFLRSQVLALHMFYGKWSTCKNLIHSLSNYVYLLLKRIGGISKFRTCQLSCSVLASAFCLSVLIVNAVHRITKQMTFYVGALSKQTCIFVQISDSKL